MASTKKKLIIAGVVTVALIGVGMFVHMPRHAHGHGGMHYGAMGTGHHKWFSRHGHGGDDNDHHGADMTDHGGMDHDAMMNHDSEMEHSGAMSHNMGMDHGAAIAQAPGEPGQGAFAAIGEIVTRLGADPKTDWSTVDIDGLRAHLLDMDDLVTKASVISRDIPGGLEMTIATTGQGGAAASRMVPAHSPMLAAETGWTVSLDDGDGALVWSVTSDANMAQIRALGFFGLMAKGGHHQVHHLGMATGQMVH